MTAIVVHHDEPLSAAAVAPVMMTTAPAVEDSISSGDPPGEPALVMPMRRASSRGGGKRKEPNSNRTENTRSIQQKLPVIYFFIAGTCLALGIVIVTTSSPLTTLRVVYDAGSDTNLTDRGDAVAQQDHEFVTNLENCLLGDPDMANKFHANHTCYINMTLTEAIKGPAYIYYELAGYFQHHWRFVSLYDRTQFTDEWWPSSAISMCQPLVDLESELCDVSECDYASKKKRQAFLCGIVANTMFNDIFWLHKGLLPNGTKLGREGLVSKGIAPVHPSHNMKNPAWEINLSEYLPVWHNQNLNRIIPPVSGNQSSNITPDYTNSTAWAHSPTGPDVGAGVENEHWRVWVEGATNQPFRKAYGKILHGLPINTMLVFAMQSSFYVRSFAGSKVLVASELSWFGSQNYALGIFFIGVGGVFFIAGVLFMIRKCANPRALGGTTALAWKHKHNAKPKTQ